MCISLDPKTGEIIECNQTLLDTLGYSRNEILGCTLFDLYAPSEKEKVIDNLESIKANRKPSNEEFVVRKKNGALLDVTLKLSFVKDEHGEIRYTNAVWRDISELKETQRQLRIEKEKVQEKNDSLLSAIRYAQRIQRGILPAPDEITEHLPKSFVFHQPKEIVSGDFYCFQASEDKVLFSVFDSTGHGIPSALLSMMGSALINQIAGDTIKLPTDVTLNLMRKNLIRYLHQNSNIGTSDGMDGSLCIYNRFDKKLQFSGANSSLVLVREKHQPALTLCDDCIALSPLLSNESHHLFEIKGDRQPIGNYEATTAFTKIDISILENDLIYIYSDGFQDQFGGGRGKKYLSKNFKEFLLELHNIPIDNQRACLEGELETWRGHLDQTDDICIWGIQF